MNPVNNFIDGGTKRRKRTGYFPALQMKPALCFEIERSFKKIGEVLSPGITTPCRRCFNLDMIRIRQIALNGIQNVLNKIRLLTRFFVFTQSQLKPKFKLGQLTDRLKIDRLHLIEP